MKTIILDDVKYNLVPAEKELRYKVGNYATVNEGGLRLKGERVNIIKIWWPLDYIVVDEAWIKAVVFDERLEDKEEPKKVTCWEDLPRLTWFFVTNEGEIEEIEHSEGHCDYERNLFDTQEQAEASLAWSQLSQLLKHVNWDWKPDRTSSDSYYSIVGWEGKVSNGCGRYQSVFLAFKNKQDRDEFLETHRELIETYFKPIM